MSYQILLLIEANGNADTRRSGLTSQIVERATKEEADAFCRAIGRMSLRDKSFSAVVLPEARGPEKPLTWDGEDAARAVVEAYASRFTNVGGRLFGPIDDEVVALAKALGIEGVRV